MAPKKLTKPTQTTKTAKTTKPTISVKKSVEKKENKPAKVLKKSISKKIVNKPEEAAATSSSPLTFTPSTSSPAPSTVDAVTKKPNTKKTTTTAPTKRGCVYIGHLPHGFFEEEVRGYFSQFGKVTKVRLSRAKKSGAHRGYGFVEFQDEEVARIAAETMNNYLMFNKVLKCHVIPRDQVHKEMFRNANRTFTLPKKSDLRKKFNAKKSEAQLKVPLISQSITMNYKKLLFSFVFLFFYFFLAHIFKKIKERTERRKSERLEKLKSVGLD